MSKLSPEVIAKFGQLQEQLWQNVAGAVAHVSEPPFAFSFEEPESDAPEAIRALGGQTLLAVQFAFASSPENYQLVTITSDSFDQIASKIKGENISGADENSITDCREFLEGIVQGICLACGIAKNEPMVASGLSIRYQALSLPDNFSRNDDCVKVEVTVSASDVIAQLTWYVDNTTVRYITGADEAERNEAVQDVQSFMGNTQALPNAALSPQEESGGLELLLDIPLEISVELGRVKMLVKEVVELGTGSVIEINKAAGEPVDVMVNGRIVARGEVVVIEDNFGVRITEILTAQERISRLGEAA